MRNLTLGDKLRNWFSADTAPPVVAAKSAAKEGGEQGDVDRSRAFELRLKALLTQPQLLAAGRVHMINLATLRERLGDAWPGLRKRVHDAGERIINRHLSCRDVHFRTADDEYIIVFAGLNKEAAMLVCAKVAEELHRLFLGDPDLQNVKIATAVGTLDGRMLFQHSSLAELLRGIGRSTALENTEPADAGARSLPPPDPLPSEGEPRKLNLGLHDSGQITTMFRPVWDVERQVISTYMSTPVRRFPDGSSTEGVAALAAITDPQHLAKRDTGALIETVEILDELFRNKFRLMVSVPVCFETLAARRTRQNFIASCQSIPDYLRQFITLEFLRFPTGVPNGRMTELVNELRPLCRWIFLRTELKQPSFTNLAGTGLAGVSALVPADRGAEARTMEDLNVFVAAAERVHLRSCVVGITSMSLAVAARAAGVTFVAGDRIGHTEEIPQHMLRFGWQDLFLRDGGR